MSDTTATDGRVIGERALQTRRRILDATAALVRENGALDLKVMDVAREVGTSPATFYQYFSDVEDAIYALSVEMIEKVAPIQSQMAEEWTEEGSGSGLDHARRLVSDYTDFWDDNGAVLRVMLLRADERDERFRQIRREYNAPFMAAMVAKVRAAQEAGRLSAALDAEATAGAMLAALDRLPNYREGFEKRGTSREAMIETVARLLHSSLTGESLS